MWLKGNTNTRKLIIIPQKPSLQDSEQAINNVLMLKTFLEKAGVIFKALEPATGPLLLKVRDLCSPDIINPPLALIMATIEPNVMYVKSPLELRNQRTFAVKVSPSFLEITRNQLTTNISRGPTGCWMWLGRHTRKATRIL